MTSAIIGPRTMEQLDSQLPAADVALDPALLDRIDGLVAPGVTLNPADTSYGEQILQPSLQVLERPPVRIRVVRDRGQWRVELTADGWPRDPRWGEPWVLLPPTIGSWHHPQ